MRRRAAQFWREESGAVAATYAIALVGLVAVAGVGFDYARMATVDSELQNGADQAALAAATQLDKRPGACARAANAAIAMLQNVSILANDGASPAITINGGTAGLTGNDNCDINGVRFYSSATSSTPVTTDAAAAFVEVTVGARRARYAFTPIVGAVGPSLRANARAGVGSAVCKVPPMMICSPDPTVAFDGDAFKGKGVVATGHSTGSSANGNGGTNTQSGNTWSPGNFGFLQVNDTDVGNRNARLLRALAYANPPVDCVALTENRVSTGNPQGLYDAINTRFGIYDFPNNSGNGNVLGQCESGLCPPAPNVRADVSRTNGTCGFGNGNGNSGYRFPAANKIFTPQNISGATVDTAISLNPNPDMGLPRDNCHYTSYNGTGKCGTGNGRFGDGNWARQDYFTKYHDAVRPSNWRTMTRYETYLWEIANSRGVASTCGGAAGSADRRVLAVAVVKNCADLNGGSGTVQIEDWVDVFLVEPSSDNTARMKASDFKDGIYIEIIGKSKVAGSGVFASQQVRRDVPYLVR